MEQYKSINNNSGEVIKYIEALIIGTLLVFFATYFITFFQIDISDFDDHIMWATKFSFRYFDEFFVKVTPYPLWHFLTKACKVFFELEWYVAASLVTAIVNACSFLLTVLAQRVLFKELNKVGSSIIFWAICLMFVGPLYLPCVNENYYLGQGTGNIWHNPSNIMVKPFAILIFCILAKIIQTEEGIKKREVISLITLIFLSGLAKPSFLQGIIPGLGLYMIIYLILDFSRRRLVKYCILAGTFIPGVVLMFFQFYNTLFGQARGTKMSYELTPEELIATTNVVATTVSETSYAQGIGFEWGHVLSNWTSNIYISFVMAFGFPVFVLLLNYKEMLKNKVVQLMLCYECAAWLESVVLYQNGPGEYHGNFLWASYLSMYIVWVITTFYFLKTLLDRKLENKRDVVYIVGGLGLFTIHLIFGIFYSLNCVHPFFG